ncbi:MAG: hypothetical protein L6R39_000819 [Caloplaca ligustica]|nr:MAG: hypothetical protein L6R39_000819 [Caloplaca ligustica]
MADKDSTTPRTEWTKNGRYTGSTELDLTGIGRQQVLGTGEAVVGPGNLIDPAKLARVFVSPRARAQQTCDLLFHGKRANALADAGKITTTEDLAEWDYGAYEGLMTREILDRRRQQGLDQERQWNIWKDGCEDGESADAVAARLDALISKIRDIQAPNMHGEKGSDVILVSHGHLLRAFVKRWLGLPMQMPLSLMVEPGGIGVLSYEHHNVLEPALMVGMALPFKPQA